MSVGVIVEFHFKPGGAEMMTSMMNERLPQTRTWEGCEDIYLGIDSDDPNHMLIVEKWESREHYDKYREWAMAQPGTENLMHYVIGEMTTRYLEDAGI
jgi:quinol monooxygenase YgiN